MKRFNVCKYGILPDTGELLSTKIQSLIDSLPNEGGEIYFPKGRYVLSTIHLRSNICINISNGAYLLGTKDFSKYGKVEKWDFPLYQDLSHSNFNCSLFTGRKLENVTFKGKGVIDMQTVWDADNIKNDITYRGAKVITLVECKNVLLEDIKVRYATDLALYFVECEHLVCRRLNLKVHIDGISPDNCKDVLVEDCKIVSGDDALVFKSTYNLNHLSECNGIVVRNCKIVSRCNAIKFGTESNGGFKNFHLSDISIKNTRESGIAIESVDGGIIDNIVIENIKMKNVNAPIFVILGKRLRGPEGTKVGSISNIRISNLTATGPYPVNYKSMIWTYKCYLNGFDVQNRWNFWGTTKGAKAIEEGNPWQFTSNLCGLPDNKLKNITLENVHIIVDGGAKKGQYNEEVPDDFDGYPEVFAYGWVLPASGLFLRHIDGLKTNNVVVETYKKDDRKGIIKIDCI